jgi:hypothetical protein
MIDIKTFSLIDDRLRAIFPASSDQLFGVVNVLLCGDFFQLPPIGGKPLYSVLILTLTLSKATNYTRHLTVQSG